MPLNLPSYFSAYRVLPGRTSCGERQVLIAGTWASDFWRNSTSLWRLRDRSRSTSGPPLTHRTLTSRRHSSTFTPTALPSTYAGSDPGSSLGNPNAPRRGGIYRFTIDLAATSTVILPGHCVAILVSLSRFPEWEPNPNTGNPLGVDADNDLRSARQMIFHDDRHPSPVVLPIIPRTPLRST